MAQSTNNKNNSKENLDKNYFFDNFKLQQF